MVNRITIETFSQPYLYELPSDDVMHNCWRGKQRISYNVVRSILQNKIDRTARAEAQNHRCAYCHVQTDAFGPMKTRPTLEHVIPKRRGGSRTDPMNQIMTCHDCNVKRGEKRILEENLVPLSGFNPRWTEDGDAMLKGRAKPFHVEWRDNKLKVLLTDEVVCSYEKHEGDEHYTLKVFDSAFLKPSFTMTAPTRRIAIGKLTKYGTQVLNAKRKARNHRRQTLSSLMSRLSSD